MENEAICRNIDCGEGYEYRRKQPAKSPVTADRRAVGVNKD